MNRRCSALLGLLIALPAAAQDWMLMGRHGECAPLSSLRRKLPEMLDVRSPDALAAYLDGRRIAYRRRDQPLGATTVVEFQVPSAGLAIAVAPASVCAAPPPATR